MASHRFELKITDSQKRERWKDEDAPPGPAGKLFVRITRDYLSPGPYLLEVRVLNRKDGKEEALVTFPFIVEENDQVKK